jgi:hypothetical protein
LLNPVIFLKLNARKPVKKFINKKWGEALRLSEDILWDRSAV